MIIAYGPQPPSGCVCGEDNCIAHLQVELISPDLHVWNSFIRILCLKYQLQFEAGIHELKIKKKLKNHLHSNMKSVFKSPKRTN